MYLIYQDEKGVKVARRDGRLDNNTQYYTSVHSAKRILELSNLDYVVVENDVSML